MRILEGVRQGIVFHLNNIAINMSFESRRMKALELLKSTGMWPSNYEPPILRALWKLGFKIPPPHFVPFWKTTLFASIWFGGAWGTVMWLTVWSRQGVPLMFALVTAAAAGIFFGLCVSVYYAYGRRKHRLPEWSSLDGDLERK